jgi:hypothetical protein
VWKYEHIGPLDPSPRVDWQVVHFLQNNVMPKDRECLVTFLRQLNTTGMRVPCDRIGDIMVISVCGYIIECDAEMRWISKIEPGATSP